MSESEVDRLQFRQKAPMSWTSDDVTASLSETRIAERFIVKLDVRLDAAERMLPHMAQAVVKDALSQAAARLAYELQPKIAAVFDEELRDRVWIRSVIEREIQRYVREFMAPTG